jgi:hypothetical protein
LESRRCCRRCCCLGGSLRQARWAASRTRRSRAWQVPVTAAANCTSRAPSHTACTFGRIAAASRFRSAS